jgi:hypothetical protein
LSGIVEVYIRESLLKTTMGLLMAGLLSTVRTSVTKSLNNIQPLRKQ